LGGVRVVLVRPEAPANVGAVARVLRNTGLGQLVLVAPRDWRTVECWRTAWGAQDVLEAALVVADLGAALAGAAYTAALSGRRDAASRDVRDMAGEVADLAPGDEAALVFGPETSGLTDHEMALCGRTVRIPSHPGQPSLNLSHAVMVAAYEVFRASRREAASPRRATHDAKEHMLGLLFDGLRAIDALPQRQSASYTGRGPLSGGWPTNSPSKTSSSPGRASRSPS
jgi:TrmH family RNA methyltransferase